MAIELGNESVTITKQRRTWRVNIETALGTDYTLTAYRELVQKVGEMVIARERNAGVIIRSISHIASQTHTCQDGTVISPLHIAEALSALIDTWEEEDQAAA